MNSDLIKNKENESNNKNELLNNENLEQNKEEKKINVQNKDINNTKNNDIPTEKNLGEESNNKIPDNNFLNDYYKKEDLKINVKKTKDGKSIIDINELLGNKEDEIPITLDILQETFENFTNNKISSKKFGIIKAYAVNTSQGIVRDYNEDRVSIVINMVKPPNCKNIDDSNWPRISYFGIFDGHAGYKCADYLKDNLLKKISSNTFFPIDIKKAIKSGFQSAEKDFLENYAVKNEKIIDKSGSCALILLTVDNLLYVANVGDSRCLISCKNGKILKDVTRDHKPNYPYEKERILKYNGNIYQSETPIEIDIDDEEDKIFKDKVILGPYRVNPGRLSVSRTLGDAEAKLPKFGGNPNVIISEPDIYVFDLEKDDVDFFILGCDGIYDQLTSKEVLDCAWMVFNHLSDEKNNHLNINCGYAVDMILKMSMIRKSYDNVTCVIVAFKDLINYKNRVKKEEYYIHHNEIKELFKKINNKKSNHEINENKEKNIVVNKNKLPSLHLHINPNKTNKFGLKKLFKDNNNINNYMYINKININTNKLYKKDKNLTIRNISVPHKKTNNIFNKNNITINKNDFFKDNINNDYSQLLMITNNNNNKNLYKINKLNNLTETSINNKFKKRIIEKANNILTNSAKNKKIKYLTLKTNSSDSNNDEDNDTLTNKHNKINNQITPISLRIKDLKYNYDPMKDYLIEDKNNINYYSANKKNSLLIDNGGINNEKKLNRNNKGHEIRLKSFENKLPLYTKTLRKTNILDRNKNDNLPLNNQLNILTYEQKPINFKKDNLNIVLNNIKNLPSIDDSNNNIKPDKPIKLKMEYMNPINQNNKIHSKTKYNSSENNRNEKKMPLINHQRRIIINPINN